MNRVLDDHTFTVGHSYCRLQIFTAAGERSVAVATQHDLEPWASLTNGAEGFAQQAWRRHLHGDAQPPRWIEHYTSGSWLEVTFEVDPAGCLTSPSWRPISQEELAELVGRPVDPGRGETFVPPEPEPIVPATFYLLPVDDLPATRPFRTKGCMPASQRPLINATCCDYHRGDWTEVMRVIEAVVGGVARLELLPDEQGQLREAITARTQDGTWAQHAALSLLSDPICLNSAGWVNGQHRAQAAVDSGVGLVFLEGCEGFHPPPGDRRH